MKRRIVRAGLAAAAIAGIAGCQNKPNTSVQPITSAQPLAATQPSKPPAATSTENEIKTPSPQALATKFEDWAREIEPLLNKRRKSQAEPSDAEFLDSSQLRLGPGFDPAPPRRPEPQPQVIAIEHPTVVATPSQSNQGAVITTVEKAGGSGANVARVAVDQTIEHRPASVLKKDTSLSGGDLEQSLTKNLRENPKEVWAQLDYQFMQWLKDKPTPQLDVLAPLPAEDRELVSAIMDSMTILRNTLRSDNNMLVSRKVRALLELADRLRAQADLIIPTLALCTKVDGFGVYDPVDPARFTAMKEHQIIVYCEVENFASHQNDKKLWETKLSQEVVLYTETGLPVWQDKTESIPDLARNRRHDFFVVKKTKFPPNITIGRYLLKVTIVDQQASRVAEATIPVTFVAQ